MFGLHALCCVLAALSAEVAAGDAAVSDSSSPYPTTDLPWSTTSDILSSTISSTTSSSFGPQTVTIAVGAEGFVFTPHQATANVGDVIRFNFYPSGHRVARAAFGSPCIPYEDVSLNEAGFDSGIQSPQVVTNNPPHFDVTVNDTDPIFYYCAAPGSCVYHHMIGVINPNKTETYNDQLKFAENATFQMAPGDPWPSESPQPHTNSSSSGSSGGGGSSSSLGTGAIAGIAIGCASVPVLAAWFIYLYRRRGKFNKAHCESVQDPIPAPSQNPSSAGRLPGYGFATVHDGSGWAGYNSHYAALHLSPVLAQYKAFTPLRAELPAGEAPALAQSPPSGY
ncbi:hypothetical protein VTK56DRAFT_4655 [Thermocarpiscus australiensis]